MKQKRSKLLSHKKIIYIHKSGSGWGGAQQNVFDLINHFRKEFQQVIFLCNKGMLFERIKSLKIPTYEIPVSSTKYFLLALIVLAKILLKEKPDIIHSNHRYATLLVQLLRSILPLHYKIIHTARSVLTSKTAIRFLGDKTIANSVAVQKNLIDRFRIAPEKIAIIYDGIELKISRSILLNQQNDPVYQLLDSSQKTIIGCFGSLVVAKGHQVLLQAVANLPQTIKDKILVLIVGDGYLRKKLEAKAQKLSLTNIVKFLGFRADAHHIMSYCHFLIIPSIQEGLPNVLVEGYLAGKPAIVSDLDYVHEIITPNHISLIFPSGDSNKLAELIQVYIEKPGLVTRHGARGKRLFKKQFNLKKNLKNYAVAYHNLLEME